MQAVRQEILDAVGERFLQGDTFKIRHKYRLDGSVCTPESKEPAMSVTRVSNGWLFCCHRCTAMGTLNDNNLSPASTRKRVEALHKIELDKKVEEVRLPYDFVQMTTVLTPDGVPKEAYRWVWSYGLTLDTFKKFQIGWSETYGRVIIPLKEYIYLVEGGGVGEKLVGWIGRDVFHTKEECKEKKIPKWLTRSKKGKRRYFTAPGIESTVVIVEDSISAIKVEHATKYTTIALLNADINDNLIMSLRGKLVYVWLDGDMLSHSLLTVQRMKQLGVNAKMIYTTKDPKEYLLLEIRKELGI